MGWYPAAVRKPLDRSNTRLVNPQRINLHTAVTNADSLAGAFRDGPFSHFYVRKDGTVEQYQDTMYRAAADLDGNDNTVSIETWDGYGTALFPLMTYTIPAWTPAQVASLVKLVRWLWETHPSIPHTLAVDSIAGPSSHGLSWHRLGCPYRTTEANADQRIATAYAAGYLKPGGIWYSKASGKTCPGDKRIAQIPGIFRDALATPADPFNSTTPRTDLPQEGFLMALTDQQQSDLYARIMGGIPDGPARPDSRLLDSGDGDYLRQLIERTAAPTASGTVEPVDLDALADRIIARLAERMQG